MQLRSRGDTCSCVFSDEYTTDKTILNLKKIMNLKQKKKKENGKQIITYTVKRDKAETRTN